MELRHLRYFIAVAEELHFARAAARLHIEQSPLSRAIKDLEYDLGVQLFERTTRSTRLTWAGQVFLDEARRVLSTLEQAKASAKAAATGYRGTLRIALSDGIAPPRLAALLAQNREEEPEVEIPLFETTLAQQLKGLCSGLYDAGFAHAAEVGEGIIAEPVWTDPLVIAVPARHPLLAHKRIPLEELIRYPLVLCHPEACEGCHRRDQAAPAASACVQLLLRAGGVPWILLEQQVGEGGPLLRAQHLALLQQLRDHAALLRSLQREDRRALALDDRRVGLRGKNLAHQALAMRLDRAARFIQGLDEILLHRMPAFALHWIELQMIRHAFVAHAEKCDFGRAFAAPGLIPGAGEHAHIDEQR